MVELLLDKGASPNIDVLVSAAKAGHVDNMEMLLPAADGNPGRRVLTAAVEGGNIEMIEMLLEEGIKPGNQALEAVIAKSNKANSSDVAIYEGQWRVPGTSFWTRRLSC